MTQGREHRSDARRPGDRLRALASRVCAPETMTRLIDPVIADLQAEHAEAVRGRRIWRARWMRCAGTIAFWKVLALHTSVQLVPALREWAAADERAIGRTIAFSAVAIGLIAMLFVALPLCLTRVASDGRRYLPVTADALPWLILYIVPQAIPVSMPIGFASGIACALRGRRATPRVRRAIVIIAVGGSLVIFALMAWIVPHANQAFRELFAHRPLPPGDHELTFSELLAQGKHGEYVTRLSFCFAPIVIGLFAVAVSAVTGGKARSIAFAALGSIAYWSWYAAVPRPPSDAPVVDTLAVTVPNLLFALIAALLFSRASRRT